MNAEQIRLVRTSWAQVTPMAETAAALFYDRLFTLDPSLRPLFANTTVAEQGRKLMYTLGFVVSYLDRMESLLPTVEALGRRHHGYGVRDEHYLTVGRALLWTLKQGLGEAFTGDVCDAWTTAYTTLAAAMRAAAAEARVVAEAITQADARSHASLPPERAPAFALA